jgi:hypothetical protein
MPRPRQRACLNQGLKLDLNKLRRQGLVRPGARSGPRGIRWSSDYWGEIASGFITANMEGNYEGWLRIQIGIWTSGSFLFHDHVTSGDINGISSVP